MYYFTFYRKIIKQKFFTTHVNEKGPHELHKEPWVCCGLQTMKSA